MPRNLSGNMVPPRHLVTRNLAKAVASIKALDVDDVSKDPPLPKAGDMRLYAFYKPSLEAGEYTIAVDQDVVLPGDVPKVTPPRPLQTPANPQKFEVVAPQFAIDPKVIHSTYPPTGHADEPRVLPHIVLTDSHLPWERPMSSGADIPWLAIIPFDPSGPRSELRLLLAGDQLNGKTSPFKTITSLPAPVKQQSNMALKMPVADYFQLPALSAASGGVKILIPPFQKDPLFSEKQNDQVPVDVIFLDASTFTALFVSKTASKTDLKGYQYLSHVRNVNTAGMTNAGVEDTGLFSIIHSLRTGPTDIQQNHAPRPQIVHMVSLEFIDLMTTLPAAGSTDLVALISLYSWSYLCQPPLSVNFKDSMSSIGEAVERETSLLRCPDDFLANVAAKVSSVANPTSPGDTAAHSRQLAVQKSISTRLTDGYSLIRQRTITGEQTVAFMRGPLVPVSKEGLPKDWPTSSDNGQAYQILDRDLGIMDLTYSTAWQLGKTVAVADSSFVAAMVRLRALIHTSAIAASKNATAAAVGLHATKAKFLTSLPSTLSQLQAASATHPVQGAAPQSLPSKARWSDQRDSGNIMMRVQNHSKTPEFLGGVRESVLRMSASVSDPSKAGSEIDPWSSVDWTTIHNWLMDRMFLAGIPNQYLITDPSHLPPERIRFFNIDETWMDCFLDGALSVANHLSRDDDSIRNEIKNQLNSYFSNVYDEQNLPWYPQIPKYGFFLRSKVVSVFPDLVVEVKWSEDETTDDLLSGKTPLDKNGKKRLGKSEVLLQRHMGKDVLLCLLDRLPDSGEFASIRLSQPPHQQRFSTGDQLDPNSSEFEFRKVYRDTVAPSDFLEPYATVTWTNGNQSLPVVYDWTSRCMDLDALNTFLFNDQNGLFTTTLTDARRNVLHSDPNRPPEADDNSMSSEWAKSSSFNTAGKIELTSAFAGLQFNDPMYYLDLLKSKGAPSMPATFSPGHPRVIRTPESMAASASPNNAASTSPTSSSSTSKPAIQPSSGKNALSAPQQVVKLPTGPIKPNSSVAANVPAHLSTVVFDPSAQGAPLIQSQFIYSVRPSTSAFVPPPGGMLVPPSFVNIDTPYNPDLIFSVTLNPSARKDLNLHEIQLSIPLGPKSSRPDHTGSFISPGLMDSYTGPGARMLSNQRWVVHLDNVSLDKKGENLLVLRLIPRTMSKTYPIGFNASLAFQLSECPISGFDPTLPKGATSDNVHIKCTEIYRQYTDPKLGKWNPQGNGTSTIVVKQQKGWAAQAK